MKDEARFKAFAKLCAHGSSQLSAYDTVWPERLKTAHLASRKANAHRYYKNPEVQDLIAIETTRLEKGLSKPVAKQMMKVAINREYVTGSLLEIVERCMQAVPVLDGNGKEVGVWKFESASAIRALELLGTDQGQFQKTHKMLHGRADPLEGSADELTQRIGILLNGMGQAPKLAVLQLVLNNLDAEDLSGLGYQRIPKIVDIVSETTIEITSGEAS
jgi:hypothetical protein